MLAERRPFSDSGSPRRFRVYNVGIAKTGSTSMARIFDRYRSGHEFLFGPAINVLAAYAAGTIDKDTLRRFVLWRDEYCLEMDSATFAVGYADILVEAFPEAKFILTMRGCYSWLDSLLNMQLAQGRLALGPLSQPWMEYSKMMLGSSFGPQLTLSREAMIHHLPETVESGLAYWSRAHTMLLTTLPLERTLVLKTKDISRKLDQIAGLAGVPLDSLVADQSHTFRSNHRFGLLREVDPAWLESRADYHCRQLMDAYFPDETLEAFLQQDRERPPSTPPSPPEPEQEREERAEDDSFAAYLGTVRQNVPPALIDKEAMDGIVEVARLLPGALALQTFGFECNLSRPEATGDFLLLLQAGAGRAGLAAGIPAELRGHPAWTRTQSFLEAWDDTQSVLSSTIDNVWLEFDVSATAAGKPPMPSVFHGYQMQDSEDTAEHIAPPTNRQIEATSRAFEILTGRPIAPAVLQRLRSCFELLPPSGDVFQLGAMIARDTDAFRVCVSFRERSQILPYLDRLGWDGERDRLRDLLGELDGRVNRLALDLDVERVVQPRIGLECYLKRDDRPQAQRWIPFLDFLTRSEIALEPKCWALLSYPGHLDVRLDGARWPASLRCAAGLLGAAAISVFQLSIHHIKLVLEPGQPLEAKAYLAVKHLWITPDLIDRTQ